MKSSAWDACRVALSSAAEGARVESEPYLSPTLTTVLSTPVRVGCSEVYVAASHNSRQVLQPFQCYAFGDSASESWSLPGGCFFVLQQHLHTYELCYAVVCCAADAACLGAAPIAHLPYAAYLLSKLRRILSRHGVLPQDIYGYANPAHQAYTSYSNHPS